VTGPLSGIVIADFSRVLSGPLATMILGDLGAEVIKIEHPDGGDDTRSWGPPFVEDTSAYFLSANRNKRSITCDLRSDHGRKVALTLADRADVLVENFRPGTMARLGLGYDELSARNPGLIYCSISGFGSGAGRDLAGYDFLVQAVGGLMSITGPEQGEPVKVGVALVDVITGLHAVIGIMAALQARAETGTGQQVELNLLSSLLASLVNQGSSFVTAGVVPGPLGDRHPSIVPYQTLQAADRPFAVAVGNDRQFRGFCASLGLPELADDVRFSSNAGRVEHRQELLDLLEEVLASQPASHWLDRLEAAGVPSGPINDLAEAFALAERLGLAPVASMPGTGKRSHQLANPISLSQTPAAYRLPPPRHGEHTREILEWLGMSEEPMSARDEETRP
jgi:crotonobetainyl-CoA:carnitine CoA-transferase CaiB-like acyl-CoA transferase